MNKDKLMVVRAALWEGLLDIWDKGPRNEDVGICNNFRLPWHQVRALPAADAYNLENDCVWYMGELWAEWPERSEDKNFPVPCSWTSPARAYLLWHDGLWDKTTDYGAARWRLLDYLIERTKP